MRADMMILKIFNAKETADAPPAEAGTPNLRIQPHDLGNRSLSACVVGPLRRDKPGPLLPPREERERIAAVRVLQRCHAYGVGEARRFVTRSCAGLTGRRGCFYFGVPGPSLRFSAGFNISGLWPWGSVDEDGGWTGRGAVRT